MRSKADIIREDLAGLAVLDLGGCGYGEENAYERELRAAWARTKSRTTVDRAPGADLQVDLKQLPLAPLENRWDITTAFDVLEHLDHPVEVLRWIPTARLVVNLPNALSPLNRRMEESSRAGHLFSFTPYTGAQLLAHAGWAVERTYFSLGKWSPLARAINVLGSLCPGHVGTGIVFHCARGATGG